MMLKRRIGEMIAKDNQYGLGDQDGRLLQRMIKELHETNYAMNSK